MRKIKVLLLLFSISILTAPVVSAYRVISEQSQEYSVAVEGSSENSFSTSTTTEVYQEQKQRGTNNAGTAGKRVQTTTTTIRQAQKGDEADDRDKPKTALRCEEIKANLEKHIGGFVSNYQQREDRYKRIYQTVTELIDRLKDKGIDVSKLQAAAANLQTQRAQLLAAVDAYTSKAEQISQLSCETAVADRQARFTELRTARQTYEQELRDVRTVINTELKTALQDLRSNTESNQ